jgi:flagellar basal body-associated protein FliL
MKKWVIILVVIGIVLSGVAFAPYWIFPTQAFHWKSYAGGYVVEPEYEVYLPIIYQND